MLRRRQSAFALLVACALVVAACTGEDADETGSPSATPSAESTSEGTSSAGSGTPTEEIATDVGVTAEPCPNAIDAEKGCIYLGILSDLTEGPFAALGQAATRAQNAFWTKVNNDDGIAGQYEVNVSEYTRDNTYDPDRQAQLFSEIEPNILALAHTLGEPTTAAILDDLEARDVVTVPLSRTSDWASTEIMVESGAPYCIQSMNALDYWIQQAERLPEPLMAVYNPDDYGRDGAAGAKIWAEANDVRLIAIEQTPTVDGGSVEDTVAAILRREPDVVLLSVDERDLAQIVAGAVDGGFDDRFIGLAPTWTAALTEHPDFDAIADRYWHVTPWAGHWGDDVAAFEQLREALTDVASGNDDYVTGWVASYPLLAALERAADNGDLTRAGLLAAVEELEQVDYGGALPPEAGNFTGDVNEQAARVTTISVPRGRAPSGLGVRERLFTGETAESYDLSGGPCFETVELED